jgi:lysozyme family protein
VEFNQAFDALIDHEGGYTNNPRDRGNWTSGKIGKGELKGTKYGISAMAYPHLDIKSLTLDQAKAIYKRDYWDKTQCDKLPGAIRFDMFDVAVNSGPSDAVKFLQRAVGADDDGILGNVTLSLVNRLDPQLLDKRLSGHRLLFIAKVDTFPTFGRGWINRIANNLLKD